MRELILATHAKGLARPAAFIVGGDHTVAGAGAAGDTGDSQIHPSGPAALPWPADFAATARGEALNSPIHAVTVRRWLAAVALALGAAGSSHAGNEQVQVGYEYATWLGSGAYSVDGRDVYILRLPFYKDLRQTTPEHFGIRALFPVSVGWLDTGSLVSSRVQTLTFSPGIQLDVEVRPYWHLKPYLQGGIGKDFSGGNLAYLGAAGIKSRLDFDLGEYRLSIGNQLVTAGSRLRGGDNSAFTRFDAGLALSHPVDWTIAGRPAQVSAFYINSYFFNQAILFNSDLRRADISTVNTVGLSLGVDRPLHILGLNLRWVGLSYVFGGGLRGVRLNTGFPF